MKREEVIELCDLFINNFEYILSKRIEHSDSNGIYWENESPFLKDVQNCQILEILTELGLKSNNSFIVSKIRNYLLYNLKVSGHPALCSKVLIKSIGFGIDIEENVESELKKILTYTKFGGYQDSLIRGSVEFNTSLFLEIFILYYDYLLKRNNYNEDEINNLIINLNDAVKFLVNRANIMYKNFDTLIKDAFFVRDFAYIYLVLNIYLQIFKKTKNKKSIINVLKIMGEKLLFLIGIYIKDDFSTKDMKSIDTDIGYLLVDIFYLKPEIFFKNDANMKSLLYLFNEKIVLKMRKYLNVSSKEKESDLFDIVFWLELF